MKRTIVSVWYALLIALPMLVIAAMGFFVAYQFVKPAPPQEVTIAAGGEGGAYFAFAQRYRWHLARQGIDVTVLETGGSVDNLQRLQAGLAPDQETDDAGSRAR